MDPAKLFARYQELQDYVGWRPDDADRVGALAEILKLRLPALVDEFYSEVQRHPDTMKVITGGQQQILRLKVTLMTWLEELLAGPYDCNYVARRWKAGHKHVEIGLDQVYTNVALSRLRKGLLNALDECWAGDTPGLLATRGSLNILLDLDLAIIEDAYQTEFVARQQQVERLAAITERQGLELAKERTEAAFRTLVEAAPSMIAILRPNFTLAYISRYAEALTGYRSHEVLGREFFALFVPDPERRSAFQDRARGTLAGAPIHGFESPIVCKDGSQRWMVWNAQFLGDYDGQPAVLAIGQDITPLKHAQEQALQSERLAAIGQMMTGLAHESGNALARSQACLEMLAFDVEDRPKALNLIARIQTAQNHLKLLYDEVRNYAAPLKLQLEPWNLAQIWRQAWENLAMQRKDRNATLRELVNDVDLRCCVDQFRLGQVFRNILDNSLAACPDNVAITIQCQRTELESKPAIQVAFRDNGPGLSAEQRERIFDPFYTTKTKGTGLGMAIATRIVEAHGGRIAVGPGAEPGAEIVVTLPYSAS